MQTCFRPVNDGCSLILIHKCYPFISKPVVSCMYNDQEWGCQSLQQGGLLFGRNQNFIFLSNQQLLNFQSCSSFSEAHWASLDTFSKLSFREIFYWTITELQLLLKINIPWRNFLTKVIIYILKLIDASKFILLFKICFSYSSSYALLYMFQNELISICKNSGWNFDSNCIKTEYCFGENWYLYSICI